MVKDFLERLQAFGVVRLGAAIGGSIIVAALMVAILVPPQDRDFGILFADLDYAGGEAVVDRLEADDIPYRLNETGGRVSILAPRDAISRLRLELAADGLVAPSGVGYELFDDMDALGATSFQQSINRLRALEGELARTITSISGVRSARVHLVLPERALFARERTPASASIMVDAPAGLAPRAVRAVVNLVAAAVPELSADNVTVLDATGDLLSAARDENGVFLTSVEEKTSATQARLRKTVEELVGRIVGPDNVRVEVAAELDLNRITENAEIIDPDSQTILSQTVIEEAANDSRPGLSGAVTVANALPGAAQPTTGETNANSSNRRTEEVTNYEISKTVRSAVREQGGVKRLSVAVALNNAGSLRKPEELAAIESLVRSAVGYDAARGDQISIAEMAFSPTAAPDRGVAAASGEPAPTTEVDPAEVARYVALAIVVLGFIFFVLRPALSNGSARPATPAPLEPKAPASTAALPAPGESEIERRIDLAQVEGQVKASSLRKVADLVKSHADESSGIVKSWIREAV